MSSRQQLVFCLAFSFLGMALAAPSAAVRPRLLRDINPQAGGGSDPRALVEFDGALFFTAHDPTHGRELWVSRGTAESTVMVRDLNPGAGDGLRWDAKLAVVGGELLFSGNDGQQGNELWKTDGTAAGTVMVKDIYSGSAASWPGGFSTWNIGFSALGDLLLFGAADADGFELWRSDGTAAGTWRVEDIRPGSLHGRPGPMAVLDGVAYFAADDGVGGSELWRSDGTSRGTYKVREIRSGPEGSRPYHLTVFDGSLYFVADNGVRGYELWRSDGTSSGTKLVRDIARGPSSSLPSWLTVFDGALYFQADDGFSGRELWRSDGSRAGTRLLADLRPGVFGSDPRHLSVVGESLYFAATDGVNGTELFYTDGSAEGIVLVDVKPGPRSSGPASLTPLGGAIYFGSLGRLMRHSSGSLPRGRARSLGRFRATPGDLFAVGELLYFTAYDEHGLELWVYDPRAPRTGGR